MSDPQEHMERSVARGPKGEQGERGAKGERGPGMTSGARHAVVFLFLLSLVLAGANGAFTLNQVGHASATARTAAMAAQRAASAEATQLALCQATNTARAQQIDLWDFLIRLSKPPATAQGRALIAEFVAHLHQVFAPRDCATLGKRR